MAISHAEQPQGPQTLRNQQSLPRMLGIREIISQFLLLGVDQNLAVHIFTFPVGVTPCVARPLDLLQFGSELCTMFFEHFQLSTRSCDQDPLTGIQKSFQTFEFG